MTVHSIHEGNGSTRADRQARQRRKARTSAARVAVRLAWSAEQARREREWAEQWAAMAPTATNDARARLREQGVDIEDF